eukprot:11741652-Alexandrium_andersonii.AAC.1
MHEAEGVMHRTCGTDGCWMVQLPNFPQRRRAGLPPVEGRATASKVNDRLAQSTSSTLTRQHTWGRRGPASL